MTVRKRGNSYVVTNKTGSKVLGRHKSRAAANRQLRAIEANKARASRHGR